MSMTLYSEDVSLKSLICRLRTARWVLPSKRTWRNVKRGGEAREDEDLLSLFHDELVDDLVQHDKFTRGMHDVISVVLFSAALAVKVVLRHIFELIELNVLFDLFDQCFVFFLLHITEDIIQESVSEECRVKFRFWEFKQMTCMIHEDRVDLTTADVKCFFEQVCGFVDENIRFRSGANGVQLVGLAERARFGDHDIEDSSRILVLRHGNVTPLGFVTSGSGNASWAGVCLLNVLYQRQCLQRLSKTHLITQDGRHCVLVHVRQERQASCLLSGAYGTRKQW
ncbi:hypothetical protein KCU92_g44, partial [Aureobasidium melanogenum]